MDHIRTGAAPARPAFAGQRHPAPYRPLFWNRFVARAKEAKRQGGDALRDFWRKVDLFRTDGYVKAEHGDGLPGDGLFWHDLNNGLLRAHQDGELRQFWREVDGIRDGRDGAYDYVGDLRQDGHTLRNAHT